MNMDSLKHLHKAIASADSQSVRNLVEDGTDVNAILTRETAFTLATQNPTVNKYIISYILQSKTFDPNSKNQICQSPLLCAARIGDIDLMSELLSFGADVNSVDNRGMTALASTCMDNKADVALKLIQEGASVNQPDIDGEIPLHHACGYASIDLVKILLSNGSDINKQSNWLRKTPLMSSLPSSYNREVTGKKQSDMIKTMHLVIENNCNLDIQDRNGNTALHLAVELNELQAACILMEKGCNLHVSNSDGITAFQTAISPGRKAFKIAISMILYGCDIQQIYQNCECTINVPIQTILTARATNGLTSFKECKMLLNLIINEFEGTPVDLSTLYTNYIKSFKNENEIVDKELASWFGDASVSNPGTLMGVCRRQIRHYLRKQLLLKVGKLSIPCYLASYLTYGLNSGKYNPSDLCDMHVAAHEGNIPKLEGLLNSDIDINQSFLGNTLIESAVDAGRIETVEYILRRGADVATRNHCGDTLLHVAARQGNASIVTMLLNRGCNPELPNVIGNLPLHEACKKGYFSILKHLLSGKTTHLVNTADDQGIYPMHYACGNADVSTVKFLISCNSFLDHKDSLGLTPLHLCVTKGLLYLQENISLPGLFSSQLSLTFGIIRAQMAMPILLDSNIESCYLESISELLKAGCDSSIETTAGKTAIQLAVEHNFVACLSLFDNL